MRAIQPPHIKYVISGGFAVVLGLAILLVLVVFQGGAQASTLTVTNTNDSGAGSLRQAIFDAAPGDTIDFSVTGTILLTSGALSVSNLTINGPGPAMLSIDGNASSRIFTLGGGAIISGLTLKNGNDSSHGGGILANGGLMTITGSTISGNSAGFGGAIKGQGGTLTIIDSTISGNLTTTGLSDIEINTFATMNLINSTVSGNSRVGVLAGHDATVNLINSTVSGNGGGGVLAQHDTTMNLINSTVSGNGGVGILHNSTLPVNLINTISALNSGSDCQGTLTSQGHNLDSDGTCGLAATGDLPNTDPLLDPLGLRDNGGPTLTIALLPGSPAIDTGDDSVLGAPHNLSTDQRGAGFPRLQGAHVDIGAFEATPPEPPQASPFTVTKTGDSNDGLCGVNDCSLREAIASGDSGDAINIPLGIYTLTLGTELTIGKNLALTGASSGDTIIQAAATPGTASHRVFNISSGKVSGSSFPGSGGGILSDGSMLTIVSSIISGNTASNVGGGIFFVRGALSLNNSTVTSNNATEGGGIYNTSNGNTTITNSTISGNTATSLGGGIRNVSSGSVTLVNSTISGNSANFGGGGGIHNVGTLTLNNSTVNGNSAGTIGGGGILNQSSGTLTLTNSTVNGNTASNSSGGGILSNGGTLTLTNSTLSGNSSSDQGGGIHNSTGSTVNFKNTIIAGNNAPTGPDCDGTLTSQGHNLVQDVAGCPITGDITGNITGQDPILGPLADNGGPTLTHAHLPGSPAIDSGDDSVLGTPLFLTTDQRGAGFPRLQGAHVDIGAFEAAPLPNTPPMADPQTVDTTQDTPVLITLRGSDQDPGDILSF